MRRPLRWLIRIAVVLAVLSVVGLVGFTWFAYWPLEGRVERVEALIPADVDFVYRASWKEMKDWLRHDLVDDPIHPALALSKLRLGDQTAEQALARVPEIERQVDAGIPGALAPFRRLLFGTGEFRVEKDLLGGEVLAAGRWCGGGSPKERPPQWRELLVATRVSSQVKFAFEALRHDFVRKRAVTGAMGEEVRLSVRRDGALEVELLTVAAPKRPQTCEGGIPMGSLQTWYVARVKDVLAVSNSDDLISRFQELGKGKGSSVLDRGADFRLPEAEGGIAAAAELGGLRSYLQRFLSSTSTDSQDKVGPFLGKFLAVDALDRLSGRLIPLPGHAGFLASGEITWNDDRLRDFKDVRETYGLAPEEVAKGIARLLPQEDTAAVALLRTPARPLLHAVFDSLDAFERKQIDDNIRRISADRRKRGESAYATVAEFLDEFAAQLGTTTGIAIARIPSVFDGAKYADYYSNDDPVPMPALAVVVRIPPGADQKQVDQWLADRVAALGFDAPEPATSPDGAIPYSRLRLRPFVDAQTGEAHLPRDYENAKPAFTVQQGHVILATREDYLLQILRTMRGGPTDPRSVASTPMFDAVMRNLPRDATFALYLHGENLRRLLWDYRNKKVREAHDDRAYAVEFKKRLIAEGRGRTPKDLAEVQRLVDAEMERWRREEYPVFVEEYRKALDDARRIGAVGIVLSADSHASTLSGGVAILALEAGPGP